MLKNRHHNVMDAPANIEQFNKLVDGIFRKQDAMTTFFENQKMINIILKGEIFVHINKGAEYWLEYTPNEIIGTSYYDIIHPDDIDASRRAAKTFPDYDDDELSTWFFRNRYRTKSGDYIGLIWTGTSSIIGFEDYIITSAIPEPIFDAYLKWRLAK